MSTPLLTLHIQRSDLIAMQLLASSDSSRYIMNGVHFEMLEDCALLVATNGIMMGALKIKLPSEVNLKEFTANVSAVKLLKASTTAVLLEVFEKEISFKLNGIKIVSERIEGNFPNWRQVVPNTPFCHGSYHFNAHLVKKLCDLSSLLAPDKGGQINLHAHTDSDGEFSGLSPYSVLIPSCDRFYGVLMPMKATEQSVPDWVKQKP